MARMTTGELVALDRGATLHPFTQVADHAQGRSPVTVMETGSGVRVTDTDGRSYLDSFAGLWCVNIGYGRTEVAEAIARQAHRLAYYHAYAGHTNEELAKLSDRLVSILPGGMARIFYGTSGSDANETAVKLAWYHHALRGKPTKVKVIARERAYHGSTVVAGSLTGMGAYHANLGLPVERALRTGVPHHYFGAEPGESERDFSRRRAQELEDLILREGPETVAALIGEPVLGTGGVVPPPEGYWAAIQEVCRQHDVLVIADEVVCGFGRCGVGFGSELYRIEPDLISLAKGLTSAYVPFSACAVSRRVVDVMEAEASRVGPLFHGYTYSGHPLGAAAANVVLDIVEREDLAGNAARVGAYMQERLEEAFAQLPNVGEVRGVGLLGGVELVADRDTKRRFDPSLKVGARIAAAARARGLILRALPQGDILGFAPPLVVTRSEVDEMVDKALAATREVLAEVAIG